MKMITIEKVNAMKGGKVWLAFFGSAAASLLVLLIPFIVRGNHLVWYPDASSQHLTFLNELRRVGWLKAIGSYDFYLGLGADFLTSMSFYSLFDPFNVFAFILPFDIVWVYDIIVVLKFFAAGSAMLCYLRYKKIAGGYAVALSLMYMFTGTVCMTLMRHLNLSSGFVYLPLMVLGFELAYRGKNPFLLIGFAFLSLVNSFYMFFFNSVFLVFYALVYHAEACREGGERYFGKAFLRLVGVAVCYLVAVLLAGFMLLPNIYGYFHAARSEAKGLAPFTFRFVAEVVCMYFLPVIGERYSSISFNFFSTVLLIAAFLSRGRRARVYRICTAVLTVGFVFPLFGWFMNICNYSNNRWAYILSFCMLSMIGLSAEGETAEKPYPIEKRRKIAKVMTAALALGVVCLIAFFIGNLASDSVFPLSDGAKIALIALLCALGAAVVVFSVVAALPVRFSPFSDRRKEGKEVPPKILDGAAARYLSRPEILWRFAAIFTVVCCFFYYCVYSAQHTGGAKYRSFATAEEKYVSELNKTEVFRTDMEASEAMWDCFLNRGVNNSYFGTFSYNTVSGNETYTFLKENAVYNPLQNLGMAGLDNRPALQSLLSVKYFYNASGAPRYGMTAAEGFESLYENENYLPFGFLYTDTLSRAYYDSLDPLLRQYAMLSGMVVEGEGSKAAAEVGVLEALPYTVSATNASTEGGRLGLRKGGSVKLTIEGCKGKELYLRLYGASETDKTTEISAAGNGKKRAYRYAEKGNLMYSAQRDLCIQFGVAEEDSAEIEISLTLGREMFFDGFAVQGYDVSAYEESAAALRAAPCLREVEYGRNEISGRINSETGGYVFLSVPYDEGWSAAVDGESAEIVRANSAFMAVRVGAGEHEIELSYSTPLLKEGLVVSCVGAGMFLFVSAGYVYLRRKKGPLI